jgi:membrane protein
VALFILVSFGLVLAGPTLAEGLANRFYLGPAFEWTWKILQWPIIVALVSVAFAVIYYFAPDAQQDWVWLTPGSIFATTLWLLASLGFKYYVATVTNYTETYGAIGGVMVLMLWFYMSGLVILIGAEMNAEIEHASPYGKEPGEKVAGEKQKIGPARWRAWVARQRQTGTAPSAKDVKEVVGDPPPEKEPGAPVPPERERSIAPKGDRVSLPPAAEPQPRSRQLSPRRGFADYVIGLGVVVTQMVLTIRSLRRKRV